MTYKWLSIDSAQRVELRQFLTSHLLAHHASLPRFLSNKFVKVITFIGRSDWPHEYPDFIRNILQVTSHLLSVAGNLFLSVFLHPSFENTCCNLCLLSVKQLFICSLLSLQTSQNGLYDCPSRLVTFNQLSPSIFPTSLSLSLQLLRGQETVVVGLQLLQTASEELGSPRSDLLTTTRRETLLSLMTQEIPTFLSTLISLLNSVAEKQRHTIAPTPPPSPGGSPLRHTTPLIRVVTPPRPSHPHLSPFTTPTQSLLAKSPSSPHPQVPAYQPFGPLDPRLEEVCVGCLSCLSHLFSWMPLSSNITPQVLDTIFYFASLGCESAEDSSDVAGLLGSLAMDCVIELLVKNCVPREFEAFLMKLFDKSFSLLQRLTGVTERGEPINFFHLHERYIP